MTIYSRRTLLSAGTAACVFGLPQIAEAAPTIKLPTDVSQRDAATITAVRTKSPVIAMTFDDGPHPSLTPALLDMLKARNLRATFYLIGNRVVTWPDIVRRIADEGHEIGNHSWSHPNLAKLSNAKVLDQIDRTSDAIFKLTGRPPVTFRPPYGSFTRSQRLMLYKNRNLPTILWSVDPQDWRRPGSNTVKNRILKGARSGSIILSHDIQKGTVRAMPGTFDGLTGKGLRFGTVSQMMGWPLWQNRQFRAVSGRSKS
ncbi:MAG: polysaccharide deacetylase family protein [Pelagimonas sp.]|jgi:peptidoglycan/xylan/chitin deacetylase (PgdA/CDA1 family)|nr:polysaccharide deacetylase family protein [Pelagimonas sp.]